MIKHRTFTARIFGSGANKQEDLRRQAQRFIAQALDEDDVISITEWSSADSMSVTVWYRVRTDGGTPTPPETASD